MSHHDTTTFRLVKDGSIPTLRSLTRAAVASYRLSAQRTAAQYMVSRVAIENLHELGQWRIDRDGDPFQLLQCRACGAGARLDMDDATVKFSPGFEATCAGLPEPYGR